MESPVNSCVHRRATGQPGLPSKPGHALSAGHLLTTVKAIVVPGGLGGQTELQSSQPALWQLLFRRESFEPFYQATTKLHDTLGFVPEVPRVGSDRDEL